MNAALLPFFGWLLRSSGQAAILTVLILLAQACLKKRLDGRWRHLLWLLVLVRLALPVSLPSPASLFNYLRLDPAVAAVSPPEPLGPVPSVLAPADSKICRPGGRRQWSSNARLSQKIRRWRRARLLAGRGPPGPWCFL
jgi:hypothetical protein